MQLKHKTFSFRLFDVLMTTFWFSIFFMAIASLRSILHHNPLPSREMSQSESQILVTILFVISMWTPVIAIGALFGRTRRGIIVGGVLAAAAVLAACVLTSIRSREVIRGGPRRGSSPTANIVTPAA
jgi:heme/copper-type cytochrome/quinol oxidase subunit 3